MTPILWTDRGPILNDDTKHVHQCADGCGNYYVCSVKDGCDDKWTCPRCEAERVDHYWSLELERIQAHLQEKP